MNWLNRRMWILAQSLLGLILVGRGIQAYPVACPSVLEELVKGSAAQSVYECGWCVINSGELARVVRKEFGDRADMSKMNILIIKNNPLGLKSRYPIPMPWKYHAVLQYQDSILDLDLESHAPVMRTKQYFDHMFPFVHATEQHSGFTVHKAFNSRDSLLVGVVPADKYLHLFEQRPHINEQSIGPRQLAELMESPHFESLSDFLNRH